MKIFATPTKRQFVIECLALLVVALVLRVWYVGKTDLGGDESFSLYMALQTVPDLVRMLCQGDNPPLWELLLHFWVRVFGISEVAIRSLSVVFSVLTVAPIYVAGEKYIHRWTGIAASLFYCCSTFSIYMAHECRVYSLVGFSTACSVMLFLSVIHTPKPYKFVLLTLANLMLMYGHYLSVWIIVMEFLVALGIKPVRQRIWKPYLIHAAALILLFAPMFPVLFTRFFDSGVNGTWIAKTTSLEALYDFLWRMCNVPVTTVLAIAILVAALVVLIVKVARKQYTFGATSVISLLWVVPLLVSFVLSFFTGFFLDRYFYFVFPVFYLSLMAYCLYLFPKRKVWGLSLMAIIVVAMALSCSPDSSTKRFSGWHSEIRPIVNQLVEAKEKENALVILPECFDKQFTYYLDEHHEAFLTQIQPHAYYVFYDYLRQAGYYYDYDYIEGNVDLDAFNSVVFLSHISWPLRIGIKSGLEDAGFRLESEVDANPYWVCRFTR